MTSDTCWNFIISCWMFWKLKQIGTKQEHGKHEISPTETSHMYLDLKQLTKNKLHRNTHTHKSQASPTVLPRGLLNCHVLKTHNFLIREGWVRSIPKSASKWSALKSDNITCICIYIYILLYHIILYYIILYYIICVYTVCRLATRTWCWFLIWVAIPNFVLAAQLCTI